MLRLPALYVIVVSFSFSLPGVLAGCSESPSGDKAPSSGADSATPPPATGDSWLPPAPTGDAGGPPPAVGDAGNVVAPDTGPVPLPATCQDADPVVIKDNRLAWRSDIFIIERHYADGSPTKSEISATFDDFTLFQGEPAPVETFDANCVGIDGPELLPGPKHCEYTTTPCENDGQCAAGVTCRETDRLDAAGIHVSGLAIGELDVDKTGVGRFRSENLDAVYGSEQVSLRILKGEEHRHFDWDFWWYFSGELAPKLVAVRSPNLSGAASVGDEDVVFQWNGGSYYAQYHPDWIVIELRVSPEKNARRVRCVVKDDGCKVVPAAAIQWLKSASSPSELHVMLSHHFPQAQKDFNTDYTDWRLISIREVHGRLKVAP